MRNPLAILASLLALALGFAAGRWSAPSPPPGSANPAPPPAAAVVPTAPAVVQRLAPDGECPQQLELARRSLAFANGLIDAQIRDKVGVVVDFPEDLPPQYLPEGFERAVADALEGCPEAGVELAFVDCAEFPCLAFFTQPEGTHNHGMDRLRGCASWRGSFEGGGQANHSFVTDAGVQEYSVASPRPSDLGVDDNALKRWQYRLDQGRAFLMDELGGREATELEQLDQSIQFWQDVLDASPANADGVAETLAGLEAQREKLVSEQGAAGE